MFLSPFKSDSSLPLEAQGKFWLLDVSFLPLFAIVRPRLPGYLLASSKPTSLHYKKCACNHLFSTEKDIQLLFWNHWSESLPHSIKMFSKRHESFNKSFSSKGHKVSKSSSSFNKDSGVSKRRHESRHRRPTTASTATASDDTAMGK